MPYLGGWLVTFLPVVVYGVVGSQEGGLYGNGNLSSDLIFTAHEASQFIIQEGLLLGSRVVSIKTELMTNIN